VPDFNDNAGTPVQVRRTLPRRSLPVGSVAVAADAHDGEYSVFLGGGGLICRAGIHLGETSNIYRLLSRIAAPAGYTVLLAEDRQELLTMLRTEDMQRRDALWFRVAVRIADYADMCNEFLVREHGEGGSTPSSTGSAMTAQIRALVHNYERVVSYATGEHESVMSYPETAGGYRRWADRLLVGIGVGLVGGFSLSSGSVAAAIQATMNPDDPHAPWNSSASSSVEPLDIQTDTSDVVSLQVGALAATRDTLGAIDIWFGTHDHLVGMHVCSVSDSAFTGIYRSLNRRVHAASLSGELWVADESELRLLVDLCLVAGDGNHYGSYPLMLVTVAVTAALCCTMKDLDGERLLTSEQSAALSAAVPNVARAAFRTRIRLPFPNGYVEDGVTGYRWLNASLHRFRTWIDAAMAIADLADAPTAADPQAVLPWEEL